MANKRMASTFSGLKLKSNESRSAWIVCREYFYRVGVIYLSTEIVRTGFFTNSAAMAPGPLPRSKTMLLAAIRFKAN